jgi:hypothetical protein
MTQQERVKIEKFLEDEEQVRAIKNVMLSYVWFDIEEFNKLPDAAINDDQLGQVTRSYAIATRLINKSFNELEKLKKVKENKALDINPAR